MQQAIELDRILRKNAQALGVPAGGDPLADLAATDQESGDPGVKGQPESPMAPMTPPPVEKENSTDDNKFQRTLFYQYEKWHRILDRELPKFDYLGKNNIAAVRSAAANVHKLLEQAFQNKPNEYDKIAVERWDAKTDDLVQRLHDSQKAKLTSTKAIVDAHLLYDTTNRLYESFKRICGKDPAFSGAMQEFTSLMHAFTNVIKSTSEQISHTDLTKAR